MVFDPNLREYGDIILYSRPRFTKAIFSNPLKPACLLGFRFERELLNFLSGTSEDVHLKDVFSLILSNTLHFRIDPTPYEVFSKVTDLKRFCGADYIGPIRKRF